MAYLGKQLTEIVSLNDITDVNASTAAPAEGKLIRYDSDNGVWQSVDASGFFGNIASSVIQELASTYDLGSSSLKWKDLYLSGN